MNNPGSDIKGSCICVHCGSRIPHEKGIPCRETKCPDCGRILMREGSYHHQLYLKKRGEENESSSTNKR